MNILLKEVFAGICLHSMLKSSLWFPRVHWQTSKFNSFAFTLSAVLYLRVIDGTNFSFIDEWREYISRVFIFAFEI